MDYKEEYQSALERAKRGLPIDEVFPELKESEDERIRKEMLNSLKEAEDSIVLTPFKKKSWITYLEKQKEQNPAEWNEDDKQTIRDAINRIEQLDHYWNRPTDEKLIKRLKSLRPHPHWKPSEEQMAMLRAVLNDNDNMTSEAANLALNSLYDDLKKLI